MENHRGSVSRPSFIAYIDESGDEGFRFHKGSSEWFVLAAAITRKEIDLETVKLIDEVRRELGKPERKPLHFRDLKHEQKLPYLAKIAAARVRSIVILVHKPSLKEPETFQSRYRLYFYATRLLIERLSWFCRDHRTHHDQGDGGAEIIFSNRSGMSYDEMRDYFHRLKVQTEAADVRIDWSTINPDRLHAFSAGKRMGLQIADAIASGFYYAVEATQYGFSESRYSEMLKPIVYNHEGRFLGYGIKFWPKETGDRVEEHKDFEWVRKHYK